MKNATSGTEKETNILTTEESAQVTENGETIELTDTDLENVNGAYGGDGWGWGWGNPPHGWGYGYGYGYGYGHGHNHW